MDYERAGLSFLFIFLIIPLIFLTLLVLLSIANWKLFKKAGRKGWESIIPFYNSYVLTEIAGLNWWWFLLLIASSVIPSYSDLFGIAFLVTLFGLFNCYYNIAKKFSKTQGQSICAGIFSFVYVFIFGFSKNERYNPNIPVSRNGIFGEPESTSNNYQTNTNNMQEFIFCGNCGTKLRKDAKFCPNCGKANQ